jgi:hypothetical protein
MAVSKRLMFGIGVIVAAVGVVGVAAYASPDSQHDEEVSTTTTTIVIEETSTSTTAVATTATSTTAAPTSTTQRPKSPTTSKTAKSFDLSAKAPATAKVGTSLNVDVSFRNLGPEAAGGYSLETRLINSAGKPVWVTGTGGLMPTGHTITDVLHLACLPLSEDAKSGPGLALEGPCEPGLYRITQTVSHDGAVVAQETTATIRYTT